MSGYLQSLCKRYLPDATTALQSPMISNFNDKFQSNAPTCDKTTHQKLLGEIIFTLKVRIDVFNLHKVFLSS